MTEVDSQKPPPPTPSSAGASPLPPPPPPPASPSQNDVYHSLVVDSGPLIRLAGSTELWKRAESYYTVPAVLQEIRDAKARGHLANLPFELKVRDASPEGIKAVSDFARLTGDYHSLSSVDLQVLGLLYDLEREANGGTGDLSHVRTTPKRVVGLGPIAPLGGGGGNAAAASGATTTSDDSAPSSHHFTLASENDQEILSDSEDERSSGDEDDASSDDDDDSVQSTTNLQPTTSSTSIQKPKSWAHVVAPMAASSSSSASIPDANQTTFVADRSMNSMFGSMKLGTTSGSSNVRENVVHGQFSDAEDDDDDDGEENADTATNEIEKELKLDFPSLAAASTVPYDDDDNDDNGNGDDDARGDDSKDDESPSERLRRRMQAEEERKQQSLRPVSNSGKLYNSFRKYGDLMKPKANSKPPTSQSKTSLTSIAASSVGLATESHGEEESAMNKNQSRIMGGMTLAGQEEDVDDDGEGWITTTAEIRSRKAGGSLDPAKFGATTSDARALHGPPIHQRSACATTDFAMQNVILQMNLELLSVDGVKVRKLKSFVTRCGACYKIYTSNESSGPLGKRLFCDKCGSDMMQRIAASVDGKTGRLRLHLSKRYKHNLRGTKFSLPKPGTGDRFKGDLLLREDQLLMGAWNQKVKMASGGKARASAQSMFGKDLATNMGCNAKAVEDDIRVGFGRRNPNAAKGRERRGKKKKSSDKACGLRRY